MRCPYCEHLEDKVIDSRLTEDGHSIRRRRECEACGRRFTTYERFEETMLMVVKKDRRREKFDRSKILNGFLRACQKRPVSYEQIERSVNKIEQSLRHRGDSEVPGQEIGELVMKTLRDLDEVAYVRFASVYKEFKDVSSFAEELKVLEKLPRTIEDAPPEEEG